MSFRAVLSATSVLCLILIPSISRASEQNVGASSVQPGAGRGSRSPIAPPPQTWYVDLSVLHPGDGTSWDRAFQRIQEGIDAASPGDKVVVSQGTYLENIHFDGKNIVLRSKDPEDLDVVKWTIIDGRHAGPAVTFAGTEDETCVLKGFTIQKGEAENGGGINGGSGWQSSDASIEDNIIIDNVATFDGGGIYNCDGLISDNTISRNKAGRNGGGLSRCSGTIRDNTIGRNSATSWGGGLYACGGTIERNKVTLNVAETGGGLCGCSGLAQNGISENDAGNGGGLAQCSGTIYMNTISRNEATFSGGGLYDCDATITENNIALNSATDGGGLFDCDGMICGNTIVGNQATDDGGGLDSCGGLIENNTISGNSCDDDGGGLSSCDALIQHNSVTENIAHSEGGGLDDCDGTVRSNTVIGNSAIENGGGLARCNGILRNNLVCGNSAGGVGGGLYDCDTNILNTLILRNSAAVEGGGLDRCQGEIRNCIIWGNDAPDGPQVHFSDTPSHCCIQEWTGGGIDNITTGTRFVDPLGPDGHADTFDDNDYHLQPDSACIDAGDNDLLNPPGLDMDGNLRIVFGRDSLTVDMGAYEYSSSLLAITEICGAGASQVGLSWISQPNDNYEVWSRDDLLFEGWVSEGRVPSHGASTTWVDTRPPVAQKFYRIEMLLE